MGTTVKIRKWGSSLGIILPKKLVDEKNLKESEEIGIEIFKIADFSNIFGILRTEVSAQELKDIAREGWEQKRRRK